MDGENRRAFIPSPVHSAYIALGLSLLAFGMAVGALGCAVAALVN